MSDMAADIGALRGLGASATVKHNKNKSAGSTALEMDDFLQLIVAQFQNQDPENAASSSDMLNQLVQMATIQAITNITDATTMMYTASLVGKTVTVGEIKDGKLVEIEGTVTGTGTFNGQPIVFVDGVSYSLSSIMAVGKLPPKEETPPPDTGDKPGEGDGGDTETKPEV